MKPSKLVSYCGIVAIASVTSSVNFGLLKIKITFVENSAKDQFIKTPIAGQINFQKYFLTFFFLCHRPLYA